jgi:hypothetical protein
MADQSDQSRSKRRVVGAAELFKQAEWELHKALWGSSSLCHAANAEWPPKELDTLPLEVRQRVMRRQSLTKELRREEWDFRARFVPPSFEKVKPFPFLEDAEVLPCFEYEASREDEKWVTKVREWRKEQATDSFSELLKLWCSRWRTGKERPTTEYYVLWPEWPDMPYLSLPPEVRQTRLRIWTGRAFKCASKPKRLMWSPPRLRTVSMNYLFSHREAIQRKPAWYQGPYEDAVVGETITFTGDKHKPWRSREYVAFDLNWENSNESMVEGFKAWLEHRRSEIGMRERELRGSASFTKRMRSELCALGAWRLVEKSKMKIELSRSDSEKGCKGGAINYTERVSGKPLYKDPLTWHRNLARIGGPIGIIQMTG